MKDLKEKEKELLKSLTHPVRFLVWDGAHYNMMNEYLRGAYCEAEYSPFVIGGQVHVPDCEVNPVGEVGCVVLKDANNKVVITSRAKLHLVFPELMQSIAGINALVEYVHQANIDAGWWTDLDTGEDLTNRDGKGIKRNVGELLMLMVTELSEGMEANRKGRNDDHLPNRKGLEVELADTFIRGCDLSGGMGYDLGGAILEKIGYNAERLDHKLKSRKAGDGKKC